MRKVDADARWKSKRDNDIRFNERGANEGTAIEVAVLLPIATMEASKSEGRATEKIKRVRWSIEVL